MKVLSGHISHLSPRADGTVPGPHVLHSVAPLSVGIVEISAEKAVVQSIADHTLIVSHWAVLTPYEFSVVVYNTILTSFAAVSVFRQSCGKQTQSEEKSDSW